MNPQPTLERVWFAYLAAVLAVATFGGDGRLPAADRVAHAGTHLAVGALVLAARWLAVRRSPAAARPLRALLAIAGLPVVFSAMAWLLPAVHPEPFEWLWLEWDRAWFGGDLGAVVGPLPRWSVELMQAVYASFYFVPLLACVAVALRRGAAAFDRALLAIVGGFLCSYLGYLLVPTLGPKVILAFPTELEGLWWAGALRASIDAAEANPWDCFPSGHTMLTITSLLLLWRWHRRWFWWLLLPGVVLIASTMLLRYHWAIDVVVGAAIAWPCLRLCDWLADRDGWPVAAGVTPA